MNEKVEFHLPNGEFFSYLFSADGSLFEQINDMFISYVSLTNFVPTEVLVRTDIYSKLLHEMQDNSWARPSSQTSGWTEIKYQTIVGPITIKSKVDMALPMFIGNHDEYLSNQFNKTLEEVLNA